MLNRYLEITLDDVRERTKMSLNLQSTTEQDDYLDVLILEGLRQLNTYYNLTKFTTCVEIEDSKAKLPYGVSQVLGVRFVNEGGSCAPLWYADMKFLKTCQCSDIENVCSFVGTYMINGSYIHFNSDISSGKCEIAYMGLNVNDDGDLIIYEDYERALSAYACWKFMQTYHKDYPFNLTFEYKKEWVAQKTYLRGSAQAEDFQRNKREIQNIFNSLTISKLINT